MCGILFLFNPNNKDIVDMLQKCMLGIQNRGRDSCGIFRYEDNYDWSVTKRYGTIEKILKTTTEIPNTNIPLPITNQFLKTITLRLVHRIIFLLPFLYHF